MTQENLDTATTKELEAALKKSKEKEAKRLAAEKEKYEKERDTLIAAMITNAGMFNEKLRLFKEELHAKMDEQAERLSSYGKMRGNSKGGFSLVSNDGQMKVTRTRSTEPHWDERSTKAILLIHEFLSDTVKKRNKKLFDILISFLEKNANGDLEYNKVMTLIQHEDKYDDPRWKEGLRLIKESHSTHLRGYGYEFFLKNSEQKWHKIQINFTSI